MLPLVVLLALGVFPGLVFNIDVVTTEPGGSGTFRVALFGHRHFGFVAAEMVLGYDSIHTPIAAKVDGTPDCDPGGATVRTSFRFLPAGCSGSTCDSVDAFASSAPDLLPYYVPLFVCRVQIPAQTEVGNYLLESLRATVSSAAGAAVPLPTSNGAISVNRPALPCCSSHPGYRGCDDYLCSLCVCNLDRFCCTDAWDYRCAAEAARECHDECPSCYPSCPGDCDGLGAVSVGNVVTAVNIALGTEPLGACYAADVDTDGNVRVNELVQAAKALLVGCAR